MLKIVIEPNEILRNASKDIETFDKELSKLSEDMLETMYQTNGIGLAAPQIGKNINLIVMDIQYKHRKTPFKRIVYNHAPLVMVNPVIVSEKDSQLFREGCLSIPDTFATVQRAYEITVDYKDLEGNLQTITVDGKLAVVTAHEIDHLLGVLFTDKTYDPESKDDAKIDNSTTI